MNGEPIQDWIKRMFADGIVAADIETAGLDVFRHPILAMGMAETTPTGITTSEFLAKHKGGYALPSSVPANAAERIALERGLLNPTRELGTRTIGEKQMLAQMDPWARKHILPYIQRLRRARAETMNPADFFTRFARSVKGKLGLVQNIKFESQRLGWLLRPQEYQELAKTARFAAKDYQLLRMIPESSEQLIQHAFRQNTIDDWWKVYEGTGGLRESLMQRKPGETMILDLHDVTRSMFAGAKKYGLMGGVPHDVHSATSVNVLELAWRGKKEAHQAAADSVVELGILQRHLNINEKLLRAKELSVDPATLMDPHQTRYLQRLSNVQAWYKTANMEKTFAELQVMAETGQGVPLVFGYHDPFDRAVYQEGVETTRAIMDMPKRQSSRAMVEKIAPHAGLAEHMAYEKQLIYQRFTRGMPEESLPKAKAMWSRIERMGLDEKRALSQMEISAEKILDRMSSTGATKYKGIQEGAAKFAKLAEEKFMSVYAKTPTPVKYAALGAVALMGLGLMVSGDEPRTPTHPYSKIEGIRRKQSMWGKIDGIMASRMPHANVSDFGSGRDEVQSAIRSAASLYVHNKGEMKGFQIRFQAPPRTRTHGIVKPQEMAGQVQFPYQPIAPVTDSVPPPTLPPLPQKLPQAERVLFKQALDWPDVSDSVGLNVQREIAAAKTRQKMTARQQPAMDALGPERKHGGMDEISKRGLADFSSEYNAAQGVSRSTAQSMRQHGVKEGERLRRAHTPPEAWVIDNNVFARRDILETHHARTINTADTQINVGVGRQRTNLTAGKIFNKFAQEGITAGTTYADQLNVKEPNGGALHRDLLSAVDSGLDVVSDTPKRRAMKNMEFYTGKAGILQSKPVQHKIGSQHLRVLGSAPQRSRHPVRSRAMRSAG